MTFYLFGLSLLCASAFAENGPFGAPSLASFDRMTEAQRSIYVESLDRLARPDFLNRKGLRVSPSYYATPEGVEELRSLAGDIFARRGDYSRVLSIGRSGTAILTYLAARLDADGHSLPIGDVPFSLGRSDAFSDTERVLLRAHLEANGLTPKLIAASEKPVLFLDFVHSGTGAHALLAEISRWAAEEELSEAVRQKLHFHGLYPARMMAEASMMYLYYASLKEGMRSEKPSAREMEKLALTMPLPKESRFRELASKVTSRRISGALYGYAGSHGPTSHESYVRSSWGEYFDRAKTLEFADHAGEDAFVELFYLVVLGRQDSAVASQGCASALALLVR